MTVEDITNRLNQYYSWLSSRQLEEWWPVLIAIAALVILVIVLVLRSRRKVLPSDTLLRDIIGIKLADHDKTGGRTDRSKKGHSAHVPEKRGRRKRRTNTKKGFKLAIVQLNERRQELIKSRQAELLLRQEAVKLETVNEQVQYEATDSKQVEAIPEQKVAEIAAVIEQFQHEITDSSRAGQHPIQKASEIEAVNEKFQYEKSEQGQPSNAPEESPEQDLKSKKQSRPFDIAEFCKAAISRRQRQRSSIFNEYSDLDED